MTPRFIPQLERRFGHAQQLGSYLAATRLLRVNTQWWERPPMADGKDEAATLLRATFEHEVIHNLQSRTTTHGFYAALLDVVLQELVSWLCRQLRQRGVAELELPLLHWYGHNPDPHLRPLLNDFAWAYSVLNFLRQTLLGDHNPSQGELKPVLAQLGPLLNEFVEQLPILNFLRHLSLIELIADHSASACWMAKEHANQAVHEHFPIGARVICESWAHFAEMLLLRSTLPHERAEQLLKRYNLRAYRAIWGALWENIPQARGRVFEDFALTGIALCDLALSPSPLANVEIWEEFHPGWRMWMLLQALQKHGTAIIDSDDLDHDYPRFVAELTGIIPSWQAPWIAAQHALMVIARTIPYTSPLLNNCRRGLQDRSAHPWSTIVYPFDTHLGKPIAAPPYRWGSLIVAFTDHWHCFTDKEHGETPYGLIMEHLRNCYAHALAELERPWDWRAFLRYAFGAWSETASPNDPVYRSESFAELFTDSFAGYNPDAVRFAR